MVNTKIIAGLPIELGIKRTYKGYFFLIAALELNYLKSEKFTVHE